MVLEQDLVRHLVEASVTVELETPDMTLNIGPQHPSTHGVLRLVAQVDGERTTNVQPVIGYMHRGYEKISEVRTYPQITALINRIDWVSGYANEIPFIVAAERLMELEVPERAQYIRMILTEMARISSHLVFNRLLSAGAGGRDPSVLRPARSRAGPRPSRIGHRRALPSQLQPDRRGQAGARIGVGHPQDDPGPPQDLSARDPRRHGQGAGDL